MVSIRASGVALAGLALASLCFAPVTPAAELITDRAALAANDTLDWSALGTPPPFGFTFLSNDFAAPPTASGVTVGVSIDFEPFPISSPFLFQTTPAFVPTNFAENDVILFTGIDFTDFIGGNDSPITITFSTPVYGAGTQFLPDVRPDQVPAGGGPVPFTGTIAAFDVNDMLIASFTIEGLVSEELDDSATFFGIRSDLPNIAKLVYSSDIEGVGSGINRLSILTVPEPSPLPGLVGVALLGGLGWWLFGQRRRAI